AVPAPRSVSLHDALPISYPLKGPGPSPRGRRGNRPPRTEVPHGGCEPTPKTSKEKNNMAHSEQEILSGLGEIIEEIVGTEASEIDRKSTRLNSSHVSISY